MRLRHALIGGAAVILVLGGWLEQAAGGSPATRRVWERGIPGSLSAFPGRAHYVLAPRVTEPRPAPYTTARPPRDTAPRAPQDTASRPPQDTTARPPQDTTARPPQDTTARPPQDTTARPPQDTTARAAAAQDTGAVAAPGDTAAGDSLQEAGAAAPVPRGLRIGFRRMSLPWPVQLQERLPDPTRLRPELRPRTGDWVDVWAREVAGRAEARRRELWLQSRPIVTSEAEVDLAAEETRLRRPGRPPAAEPPPAPPPAAVDSGAPPPGVRGPQEEILPEVFSQYADLGVAIQGRVELGGGWNKFRPCNVSLQINCDPGLIPNIRPDIQFGARLGGTISERIHVNVDYDNRREFDAANNINVYYQGLEDEILQRFEIGDVTFPLPQSRYLTQGIPAGNFGFRATGQMGPIEFQTVYAQQKGDVGTRELQVGGSGQGFEQEGTTILDDADYERGKFFFLFNPRRLPGHPHIDIQRLNASDAPPDIRPASVVKVYRYEALGFGAGAQVPEGFITAVATAEDTLADGTVLVDNLSGLFRPLEEGVDYILHRSGLWIQLRNTLPDQDGLAITYRTADGGEIGTFNAEEVSDAHTSDPSVDPPNLELIKGVNHRPGTPTWTREMHHIYRVSASPGVVESSIELKISQGDPAVGNTFRSTPSGTQLEFLKIFGLDDDPTDDRIDISRIYEVTTTSAEGTAGPSGTYVVPPTLEPFLSPPPLRGIPDPISGEPFPLDPGDRNSAIYNEPNDQIRRGSNLYLLTISYRQRFEGFLSTISLGAGGVREGSERLIIDDVDLVRGEDYTIDYDIGQIELREPERWFAENPNARIRVSFEQKPLFQLAPTSVFGFQARYGLGEVGELNFIGLSQTEKTLQIRPELGLEPSAVQLGGVSGRLNFQPGWLTELVDALPLVEAEAASAVSLDGEVALSMPSTNTEGVTYVEDFEGGTGFTLSMLARAWRLGSAPENNNGAPNIAPPFFLADNAAELVWQDQYALSSGDIFPGLLPQEIDPELRIEGQSTPEPVLTLTLRQPENRRLAPNPDPPPERAWASITSVISTNGQDFTTIEFLEFYVAVTDQAADSTALLVDLGTVSEDAFAIDSLGAASGIGQLDREVDPPQIWTNADDVGLWGTGCEGRPGLVLYPLGNEHANCTRNNGLEDSEDLNQNRILDDEDRFFRYTVDLGDPTSPYFVREAQDFGGATFRLYRIPLRRPDHRQLVSDAEFQNIRHLRLTVVSESNIALVLARPRFLGSRWLKRGRAGVVEGVTDTTSAVQPGAQVEVGPISTLDARYVPPPGVTDQAANQGDQFNVGGLQTNEQSLSIRVAELGPDQRAEVYLQYAQTPRDFLAYRALRAWALGAEGEWGTQGEPLRFFIKLGEDARNFYLFQTSLSGDVAAGAPVGRQSWLPELEVDFERFISLRARAEDILLREGGLETGSVLEIWDVDVFPDGDSTYAVVISQRSRAPNLAAIRQISMGIINAGGAVQQSAEVWVDDLRLDAPVDNTGVVGQLTAAVRASDFLDLNLAYSSENPYFRQLAQQATFNSSRLFRVGGRMQFGELLPRSWALRMPVSVSYSDQGSTPLLLPRTDIQAEQLTGLRAPASQDLRMDVNLSKQPTGTPYVGWLLDNSSVRLSFDQRESKNSRSTSESDVFSGAYSFRSEVGDVSVPLLPGFLGDILSFLPGSVEETRLRLSPRTIQLSANYVDSESRTRRFEEIVELPQDTAAVPIRRLDERLQTNTSVNFEPFNAFTGQLTFSQGRELVPTNSLVQGGAARRLIDGERSDLLGLDIGWETGRTLNQNWTYRPTLARWLTGQASLDTRFRMNRGASFIGEQDGDTILSSDFSNSRSLRLTGSLNLPVLMRSVLGGSQTGPLGLFLGLAERLDVVTATWVNSLTSAYQRQDSRPSLQYQLAFHGFGGVVSQDGNPASRVLDGEVINLSSGVRLPLGAGVNFDYSRNDQFVWTPITRSNNLSTSWPSVSFIWSRIPTPAILRRWVASLGLRTGYTRTSGESVVLGVDQDRLTETRTIPFGVDLALTTDWSFNYNMSFTESERRDPTGVSFGDNDNYSFAINGRIRPLTRQGSLRNPIRVSLRYTQNNQFQCRRLGAAFNELPEGGGDGGDVPPCEPFTDLSIRNVDLTVNTDIPPFILGLQGSWRDTQSELGQRPGSTQLEISLFGQFLFETGEIR